jgi:formylglycine-generating enzyme required for sulfatase activity
MGSDLHYPEEASAHRVRVSAFFIDETPVTNRSFHHFVEATRYVTFAERPPDPKAYPGARPDLLVPGPGVFLRTTRLRSCARRTTVCATDLRPAFPRRSIRRPAISGFRWVVRAVTWRSS